MFYREKNHPWHAPLLALAMCVCAATTNAADTPADAPPSSTATIADTSATTPPADAPPPSTASANATAAPIPPPADAPAASTTSTETPAPSAPIASTTSTEAPAPIIDNSKPTLRLSSPEAPVSAVTSNAIASAVAPDPASSPISQNVTVNLINLMVKRGLITRDDADGLIKQAQVEAETARAQAASTQAAAERALAIEQQAPPAPASTTPPVAPEDEVRIAYVPDVVKKQITQQVTQDVMQQTREEHLIGPDNAVPDWVKRFRVTGDVRVRYEGDFYPSGNAAGFFTNYNAINTGSGLTFTGAAPGAPIIIPVFPQYNVDQNRNRFRLRARIGAGIDLGDGFTTGLRIATGSDDNPVSENQTFGGVNSFTQGQGGNFGKYAIWLDRAFIRYELGGQPDRDLSFTIGRFDNPFLHTSMLWSDDLAFDGAVVQGKYQVTNGVTPFLTFGGFPIFNTDLNFSSNQSAKFQSEDKYLIAAQGGTTWQINRDFTFKGGVAFYDFENVQGQVSNPITNASLNAGNTDDSRPTFAQNGNSYIALRDFEDPNSTSVTQYYGLATPYRELDFTGQFDFSYFDPFHISLLGEVVKNLAFDRNDIIHGGPPVNSGFNGVQNNTTTIDPNTFYGGDTGYMIRLNLGKVALEKRGDWSVSLTYRYVETDATVDAFADSDFGGGLAGTNLEGYTIGGRYALSPHVSLGLQWMGSDAVAGPTYENDLIQFDLNAKF